MGNCSTFAVRLQKNAEPITSHHHHYMKAKLLHVKNFKNVIDAELAFDEGDSVVVISGKNGAGKSSIVQALFLGIAGKTSLGRGKDVEDVVRHGADKAEISITLADTKRELRIKYSVTSSGTEKIDVWASDGGKVSRADLSSMLSQYTIDPLWFSSLKPTERYDEICRLSGIDVAGEKASLEEAKRALSDASAALRSAGAEPTWDEAVPTHVDTAALREELRQASSKNEAAAQQYARKQQAQLAVVQFDREIAALQERRKAAVAVQMEATLPRIEVSDVTEKLKMAESSNMIVVRHGGYLSASKRWGELNKAKSDASDAVKQAQDGFREKVASAKLPVPGLKLDENGELYLGATRFDLLNTAERIKAAVRVAAAANPALKVISVEDGSRLDEDGMKALEEIADELGYQVFVERVGEEKDSIVIREGKVVTQ
jgi:energy-coupling factor transporter ATP-binding protein EcfA2